MTTRKTGKFYVDRYLVFDQDIAPVLALLEFVPLRVEYLADREGFEYVGMSPRFNDIEIGKDVPEYQLIITTEEGKIAAVEAKRR